MPGPNNQGGGVAVSMAAIIDQLHSKYSRLMTGLMQENAELQAGLEAVSAERDELRGTVTAMASQPDYPEGQAPGDPLGLRPFGGRPLLGAVDQARPE